MMDQKRQFAVWKSQSWKACTIIEKNWQPSNWTNPNRSTLTLVILYNEARYNLKMPKKIDKNCMIFSSRGKALPPPQKRKRSDTTNCLLDINKYFLTNTYYKYKNEIIENSKAISYLSVFIATTAAMEKTELVRMAWARIELVRFDSESWNRKAEEKVAQAAHLQFVSGSSVS